MKAMTCRNCGAGLSPDTDGRGDDLVVCDHCGSVHQRAIAVAVDAAASVPAGPAPPVAPRQIALPSRFDVQRRDGALIVSWRKGRRAGAVMLGLFSLAWLGMGLVAGVWPLLIMVPLLGYYALVRGLNRVTLHAGAAGLIIRQGPLPWPGARRLEPGAIAQLFSVEKLSTVRSGQDGREQVRTHRHYRLRARLSDDRRIDVVTGLANADQALWLEREAERALGIVDVPTEGEMRR